MLDSIIRFSIWNKLIIGLVTLALVLWSGYSLSRLPIDALPDITNNQVQVITRSPSLAAQGIERLVTFPIEQTMATIPQIVEIRSFSRFGLSVVTIVFTDKTDLYWARKGGLLAEITVFEGDLARMQVGQRVRLSLVGIAGERTGRIKLINQEVNHDRTVRVYASLDNPVSGGLRPGTYVKAVIETGAATESALPEPAVVQSGSSSQIFVFVGKEDLDGTVHYRFRPVPVRAGTAQNVYRAIQLPSGVAADASVVLAGAYDILSASAGSDEGGDEH